MDLYFAPLACSLASRISLYEAGLRAAFHEVTLSTKKLDDGSDYLAVNPKGQVPALRTDAGRILTEVPAVLQYIADLAPEVSIAPLPEDPERYELQLWLNYVATELHKAVFYYLFNPATPQDMRVFVREVILPPRYDHLTLHLDRRDFLLTRFTVADAYLFTSLNWAAPGGVDLAGWPVLAAYHARLAQRPAVARALSEELGLRKAA